MQNHRPLILENYQAKTLIGLLSVPLEARTARIRNKFILLLTEPMNNFEEERMKIIKDTAELDENGEPKMHPSGTSYIMRDKEEYARRYDELAHQKIGIPCKAEQFADFMVIASILDNLETRLDVKETAHYNEIMEIFEDWGNNPSAENVSEDDDTDGGVPAEVN